MKKWILFLLLVSAVQVWGELQEQDVKDVVQEVNPATPVRKFTQEGLDKTINQVSPVEISLEPGIVKDEKECERACDQERDHALSKTVTEIEKGYIWRQYAECRKKCPDQAAKKNELDRGPF